MDSFAALWMQTKTVWMTGWRWGMNEKSVLNTVRLPARLTPAQVGELLNITEAEVTILMRLGLLKPLASPAQNSHKWFSAKTIMALADDERWLSRATQGIYNCTKERNSKTRETALAA